MKSNHPPNVLKQIPKGIGKRLSEISSSEEIFKQAAPLYEEALKNSGFTEKIEYRSNTENRNIHTAKKNRRRKIIWYNPPFSTNVKTNIGKEFLKLLKIHFHKKHMFYKIFNKNTVKISYSCMRNISSIIAGHNKMLMKKPGPEKRQCNCPNSDRCPLNNRCLTENMVYEAEITSHPDEVVKEYRGLCSTTFKARLGVHKEGFNHRKYSKGCELAIYVWELKDNNKTYDLNWKFKKKVNGRLVGGVCKLCTTEQLSILDHPNEGNLLNSNCIQKCRHDAKYMLSSMGKGNSSNDSMD